MLNLTFKNFVKLTDEEKRLVLDWRNSDRIRLKMNNKEIISLEKHLTWLETLKNREDSIYYLCFVDDTPIGVFDFTNIDKDNKSCVGGAYIGDTDYLGFGIVQCFYIFVYAFEKQNWEKIFADVLKSNKRVYKMHKQIFNAIDLKEDENSYFIYWDKNIWDKNKTKLIEQIKNIYEIETVKWVD